MLAVMDLKLVQLIRGAMHAADAQGTGCGSSLTVSDPQPDIRGRRHYTPEPTYLPRRHITPEVKFERRPVIHPTPRVEVETPVLIPAEPIEAPKKDHRSPFVPPWKVMPWEIPAQPAQKVKVVKANPDIAGKGTLIDCFM